MTCEGLGEMFEGDSRHVRRKNSAHVDGEPSGGSRVRKPGSEDPHRRERNLEKLSNGLIVTRLLDTARRFGFVCSLLIFLFSVFI